MLEKLKEAESRYDQLTSWLSDFQVMAEQAKLSSYSKEYHKLEPLVSKYREYKKCLEQIDEALKAQQDEELRSLATEELKELEIEKVSLFSELEAITNPPREPEEDRNAIVEIRAGTGGEEASLFAADLYRMYSRYSQTKKWKSEVISSHPSGKGGFKEIIFSMSGQGAYRKLKHESGVHRVQRVPATESSGRLHTSAASVAVLPEAEEVEVEVKTEDLKIELTRASGPGGQHVNVTDSAVKIIHLPS